MDIDKYFERVNKKLDNMSKKEFIETLQRAGVDCKLKENKDGK